MLANRRLIESAFVLQHEITDCGVACLLSLIRYYGGDSTIAYLREISGTSIQGTSLLGLYQAANKSGFKAMGCESDIESLIDHGQPVVLHTLNKLNIEHYVICYGYDGEKFIISDPSVGVSECTIEELDVLWASKRCLTLEPSEKFVKKQEISYKKKKWIKKLIKEDIAILGVSVGVGIIVAGLGMVMAVFSQQLVDTVLPQQDYRKLILGIIVVTILLLAKTFISALRQKLLLLQGRNFNNRIIDFFYKRLLMLPKPFFDTRKIGDMVARLNDTRRIQSVIVAIAGNTVINALVVLVSLGFLAYYSWEVCIIALLSMPIYYYVIYKHNNIIISQQREMMAGYSLTESNFISTISGVATIKSHNKQRVFQKNNKCLYEHFQQKVYDLGQTQIRIGVLADIINIVILMGLVGYSSYLVIYDKLSIGEVIAVIGIAGSLFPAIADLALISIPINEAKVAFDRMFDVIGSDNENDSSNQLEDSIISYVDDLHVNNLSFRFTGRKRILSDINMQFLKGNIYCIVGESGCGKSTFCQVLQRFYDPEMGEVLINGINSDLISISFWNDLMSVAPQDIFIYNGTVIDNICFGEVPEDLSTVLSFCQQFRLDVYFDDLPQGLMTIVGEEGINLSGGQKQLLAFARALYKSGQILLLDEITSAMDRKTELYICDILHKIKADKIIIFITHRLQTVKHIADFIYVMKNGEVEAFGSHEQLIETDNFYSQFWR